MSQRIFAAMMLKTYRSKLIAYSTLLMVFLCGTLIYSYLYARSVIVHEADNYIGRTGQLLESQMQYERNELLRYAGIVSDDLRIQEYMFIVMRVSFDREPLLRLYEKLFGWLPIDRKAIIGSKGELLVGDDAPDLAAWVRNQSGKIVERVYYMETADGLEMVATVPISYRGEQLGMVALSHRLNKVWLNDKRQNTGGQVFVVRDSKVVASSLVGGGGEQFIVRDQRIAMGGETFRVFPIDLPSLEDNLSQVWFGVSETKLISNLNQYTRVSLLVLAIGSGAMLWMGLMIFRNFNRPLVELMSMIEKITMGDMPVMKKSRAHNEIDLLANKFADMVHSLRNKQSEIDGIHKQLEESAITDSLTGLYNRRHLQEIFPKLRAQALRDWRILSVILCDLDYFKQINDQYGHLAGDQCLIQFAKLLKQQSRSNDFLYRVGGEEFLILSISSEPADSVAIAEKVRLATKESALLFKGRAIPLTVSCGVSFSSADDPEETALPRLLSRADQALYQAKEQGRNQVQVYGEGELPSARRDRHR